MTETTQEKFFSNSVLRQICLDEGADDVGFVEITRETISHEVKDILKAFNRTKTLMSIIKKANRDSVQSQSLPVVNDEFIKSFRKLSDVSQAVINRLNALGIRGVSVPAGFPMDFSRWPGKIWDISHKTIATEAGIGNMGLNRLVIHPIYGNTISLGTILIDAGLDKYDHPIENKICINCKLCSFVCPVGAIDKTGDFNFMSCAMHNYHDLIGGFQDWIEGVVSSKSIKAYRAKHNDTETMNKWQSLTLGSMYRCSYCMAVCPAGKESLKDYTNNKKLYFETIVMPLRTKKENVYVIPNTIGHVSASKNPDKTLRFVNNTIRPNSIESFKKGITLAFNQVAAKGVNLKLLFEFTGKEPDTFCVSIHESKVEILENVSDTNMTKLTADSETWVKVINNRTSLLSALVTGKVKIKWNPLHVGKFKKCLM
ncbi:MAG: 4Fe-4S binding protein [Nitrospirae bacterium]|nr:4Fe-4S binding protein [Nitrospirota bacterium]MBF0533393.1 4Fe-4S binding protein [Nitrospirota bacterium]MBF0616081.1 4Fe-4S binding protein [Nitrospirota bacterium]